MARSRTVVAGVALVHPGDYFRLHICALLSCEAHRDDSKYDTMSQPLHVVLADPAVAGEAAAAASRPIKC